VGKEGRESAIMIANACSIFHFYKNEKSSDLLATAFAICSFNRLTELYAEETSTSEFLVGLLHKFFN